MSSTAHTDNPSALNLKRFVAPEVAEQNFMQAERGIKAWLTTIDHKKIGLMYLASIIFFFFVGGMLAIALRLELWGPAKNFIDAETYNQIFTLTGLS